MGLYNFIYNIFEQIKSPKICVISLWILIQTIYKNIFSNNKSEMKVDPQFEKIEINSEQIKNNAKGYKDYSSCSLEDIEIQKKNNSGNHKITNYTLLILLVLFIGQLISYVLDNSSGSSSQLHKSISENVDVTVIFPNSQDATRLRRCLESFYTYNTYPIKKIIVAGSGKKSDQIDKILSAHPEIIPLYSQQNVGEVVVLDMVMKLVETQYYLTVNTQYQFIRKGFIEKSLEVMEFDNKLGSAALTTYDMDWGDNCSSLIDGVYCGFSFLTAMHKKSDYDNLPEDYTVLTGNYSYGQLGGDAKFPIIYHYYLMGKRSFYFFENFVSRIVYPSAGKKGYRVSLLKKDYDSLNVTEKGEYTVAHSWRQMFNFYNEKMKIVNQQYSNGFVRIPYSSYKIRGKAISQYGIDKQIQANTQFDYLNISKSDYYKNFIQQYSKLIRIEKPIQINSEYKSKQKLEQLLKNEKLSVLCITIKGSDEDFSSPRFESLLKSFSKQAYTDVIVAIFANSNNKDKIQQKIKEKKLSDDVYRILVYEDNNNYGSVGLSYVQKKVCPRNSVIVNLKPTDTLLNSLSLKFIKKAYEDPNLMFATFKSKSKKQEIQNLDESIIGKFRQKNELDLAPFLKTYRQQMTYPNIISYLTEFVYNVSTLSLHPKFYSSESEDFHAYSLIEMAGQERVKFFDDIIIDRQEPVYKEKCKAEKEEWTKTKARLKTPIQKMEQFYYPVKEVKGYKIPNKIVQKLSTTAEKYQSCLKSSNL